MNPVRAVLPVCVSVHVHHTCSRMETNTQQLMQSEDKRVLPPVDNQGTQGSQHKDLLVRNGSQWC